jgi:signal transduction histidine kinase
LAAARQPPPDRALGALQLIADQVGGPAEELPAFYGRLGRCIADLVGARAAGFFLLENGVLSLQPDAVGIDPDVAGSLPPIPCPADDGELAGRIVFGGEVFRASVVEDSAELRPYRPWLAALGARHLAVVPWAAGSLRLGFVLAGDASDPNGFTDDDAWVLQAAAMTAALVWQQNHLTRRLLESKEKETDRAQTIADRMTELEQLKGHILNLAAHELRGPLAIIRGYLSMISDDSLDPAALRRVLPILNAKASQMDGLVTQMLEVARLEEGRLEVSNAVVDLGALVREAVDVAALLAPAGLIVFLERPKKTILVHGDAGRIGTIVSNLLDNAIKYSPGGGAIICRLGVEARQGVITVADEGLGIDASDMPRLFTRFGRIVTRDNSHIAGTGLGLHLSRELARLQGGDISVETTLGVGSTFTVRLPLHRN